MDQPKISIGRTVHFVMADGEHRPAIVVRVWDADRGTVNLQVFTDCGADEGGLPSVVHRASIAMGTEPGTWHWPEREEQPAAMVA